MITCWLVDADAEDRHAVVDHAHDHGADHGAADPSHPAIGRSAADKAAALPFSGIHQEVAAGTLSAALVPWIRADRVMALPRSRPVSRATNEVVAVLKQLCRDMIRDGIILTAPGRARSV